MNTEEIYSNKEPKSFTTNIPPMTLTVEKILAELELTGRVVIDTVTSEDLLWPRVHDDELVAAGISHCWFVSRSFRLIFFKTPAAKPPG